MSTLNVDKVDPSTGTDLELGTSGDTITVPSGATLTVSGTMNASSITAGTMATARLGTGTASSSTVLYGDQTYKAEPGGGITEADNWRITSNFSGGGFLTANWERNDSTWFSVLGSGMSESSGIFTFPSTGYWKIEFTWCISMARDSEITSGNIYITLDDSNYIETFDRDLAGIFVNQVASAETFNSMNNSIIFDVTDVSNDKCKFYAHCPSENTTYSSTVENATSVTFLKLGDT